MNVLFTVMDRYGNTNNGTVVVQRCIGTEAKLYDCWYYSVDSRLCTSDVVVEWKVEETLFASCPCSKCVLFTAAGIGVNRNCAHGWTVSTVNVHVVVVNVPIYYADQLSLSLAIDGCCKSAVYCYG